jgi:hypothetical protein
MFLSFYHEKPDLKNGFVDIKNSRASAECQGTGENRRTKFQGSEISKIPSAKR